MASMRTVILLALSAEAVAQLSVVVETTAAPEPTLQSKLASESSVTPPLDVLCPSMSALGPGTYLHTEPWTFGRVVRVMQKSSAIGGADIELGTITSNMWSLRGEYLLTDPINHKLIARWINPSFFWDTQQELLDCKNNHLGFATFDFNFLDFVKRTFTKAGQYHTHEVKNTLGEKVATLSQEELTTKNGGFLGSRQHYLYLSDNAGAPLAAMRAPSGGWTLGPFGEHTDVQVEMLSSNPMAPKPSMDPEFLSLAFANGLATGTRFSPGVALILQVLLCLLVLFVVLKVFCGCFESFCGCCDSGKAKAKAAELQKSIEEKEGLLATRVNSDPSAEDQVKSKGRDIWACCSRRGTELEKKVGAVAPK